MGPMIEQFPISWNFEKDISVAEFLDGLAEKALNIAEVWDLFIKAVSKMNV